MLNFFKINYLNTTMGHVVDTVEVIKGTYPQTHLWVVINSNSVAT